MSVGCSLEILRSSLGKGKVKLYSNVPYPCETIKLNKMLHSLPYSQSIMSAMNANLQNTNEDGSKYFDFAFSSLIDFKI